MSKAEPQSEGTEKKVLHCSFCSKSQHEVIKLVASPGVCICDECIEICANIVVEAGGAWSIKLRQIAGFGAIVSNVEDLTTSLTKIADVQEVHVKKIRTWLGGLGDIQQRLKGVKTLFPNVSQFDDHPEELSVSVEVAEKILSLVQTAGKPIPISTILQLVR